MVLSVEEWETVTGDDYKTPQRRQVKNSDNGDIAEVLLPLVPAREKDKNQHIEEFGKIGFNIEKFIEMDVSAADPNSASIYVRK